MTRAVPLLLAACTFDASGEAHDGAADVAATHDATIVADATIDAGRADVMAPDVNVPVADATEGPLWDGLYGISEDSTPVSCTTYVSVQIAGADAGGGQAIWRFDFGEENVGTVQVTAPDTIEFGLATSSAGITMSAWTGFRQMDGSIEGDYTTSGGCSFTVTLTPS